MPSRRLVPVKSYQSSLRMSEDLSLHAKGDAELFMLLLGMVGAPL